LAPDGQETERASLGSFGEPLPADQAEALDLDLDFAWYGATVRVHPYASVLDLMEFMAVAGELDERDPRLVPPLVRLLKAYVHPEDYPEFWRLARANHATPDVFMGIVQAVTEYVSERPTVRPAASTGGPRSTPETSTPGLSSQDLDAISALRGRPDLGEFVLARAEHDAREKQQA
jgi:hypothetical protein